jgi:hypothetical protein
MVVSSVGRAQSDSPEAARPGECTHPGLRVIGMLTRCEIMCEERIAKISSARSDLSLQSFALEQGSGSELGDD